MRIFIIHVCSAASSVSSLNYYSRGLFINGCDLFISGGLSRPRSINYILIPDQPTSSIGSSE